MGKPSKESISKSKTSLANMSSRKKISKKKRQRNSSIIIITDDEQSTVWKTPKKMASQLFQASTPIDVKRSNSLKPLNLSEVKQNNDLSANFNQDVINLTREINSKSFITIDLTDSVLNQTNIDGKSNNFNNSAVNTVIDLENVSNNVIDVEDQDCTFVSASSGSLSSNVTVQEVKSKVKLVRDKQLNKYANGIAKLNQSEKGRLLELITEKIFSGCDVSKLKSGLNHVRGSVAQATDTEEDAFIKEVILGQTQSRNSVGSNVYNPERDFRRRSGLRMVVIDGSNVAMEHGKGKLFSVKGLKICIDYFVRRGHVVKAFVPRFRCKFGKSSDGKLLDHLERQGLIVYTPSREVKGKMITSYDDRYIIQCAAEFDGVVVSGDQYRDLAQENPKWRQVIEKRLLPFTWVQDMIMFPKDPLGRHGPTLEQFLRFPNKNK